MPLTDINISVLVIEDEAAVISLIKRGLMEQGAIVSVALDGQTGLQMAIDHNFDIILLDIMLPGVNGLEVCKQLRRNSVDTPILILTALGSTENIVTGLDTGADDYLVKPFKLSELYARMRALVRRNPGPKNENLLTIGDLSLNTSTKIANRAGIVINLTATEYRLLEFFMRNAGRVLSRMEILENVWDINFNLGTNVVDVYVNYIRKKIDKQFDTQLIHTLVGMGYMLKHTA